MKDVKVESIVVDQTIDVRSKLNEATVARYAEQLDQLPPITLFGDLLADGFHRVAAAKRLGWKTIKADVKPGGRDEAMVFAASANVAHGEPLTQKERRAAAERLIRMCPKKSQREIARDLGLAHPTVKEIADGLKVAGSILPPPGLSPSHLDMLSRAPEEAWQPLADAAAERGWTAHETRLAAQVVRHEKTPKEYKEKVLAGKADPYPLNDAGEPTVSTDTISRRSKEAKRHGLSGPLHTLLAAAATLEDRVANGEDFESRLSPSDRQRLDRELQRFEEFIPHLRSQLVGGLRPVAIKGGRS